MRRCLPPLLALCGIVAVSALNFDHPVSAARLPQARSGKRPLEVDRCRVKLIRQVMLASDRPGLISLMNAEEGKRFSRDDQVVGLSAEVAQARMAKAEKEADNDIEIRYAQAAADVAKIELEKAILANGRVSGAIPDIEINRLRLARERSVLQIEQAEHDFELNQLTRDEARAELKTYQIFAPFDGVVTNVYKHVGEAVVQGDPILELTSTRRVRIEGLVNFADLPGVEVGAPVTVRLDIEGVDLPIEKKEFSGRIVFIDVTVEPVTHKVRVWAEVENSDNLLRAGLTASMKINAR